MWYISEAFDRLRILESKEDIQKFVDKFGQETYDEFTKYKQRIKNLKDKNGKKISTDILYHCKNTSAEEMSEIIRRAENREYEVGKAQETDIEGKLIPNPTNTKKKVFSNDKCDVWIVTDYEDMIDISSEKYGGIIGRWCIAGRYQTNGEVKVSQAVRYFNDYRNRKNLFNDGYLVIIDRIENDKYCVLVRSGGVIDSVWDSMDEDIYADDEEWVLDEFRELGISDDILPELGITDLRGVSNAVYDIMGDSNSHLISFSSLSYISGYYDWDELDMIVKCFSGDALMSNPTEKWSIETNLVKKLSDEAIKNISNVFYDEYVKSNIAKLDSDSENWKRRNDVSHLLKLVMKRVDSVWYKNGSSQLYECLYKLVNRNLGDIGRLELREYVDGVTLWCDTKDICSALIERGIFNPSDSYSTVASKLRKSEHYYDLSSSNLIFRELFGKDSSLKLTFNVEELLIRIIKVFLTEDMLDKFDKDCKIGI